MPYSYVLVPFLIDCLQTLYCSLTNPPIFYKYCLLPPMYISCFWQSANASSQSPASKLFLRCPYLCIMLYLFTSVSPYQVSESCRSPVQV